MSEWYRVEGRDGEPLGRVKLEDGHFVGRSWTSEVKAFFKFIDERRQGRALEYFSVQGDDPYTIGTGVREVGPDHEKYWKLISDELSQSVSGFGQLTRE